ncbi:unnamed protein product [Cyprideis torosa]|uniref:small monomeric GTPase n=1 Tax=Cyprideis torosa TaxID=163714 RepID=A0A7R8WFK4_9CRUS|nr:unnamed protein product [Cyprideis torosa]CAG0897096.1 unnamed protein product [Cyprideis torosa]
MSNVKKKNFVLKVILLGNGGVGKTCLMTQFVKGKFDENSFHTIGVEFLNKDLHTETANYTLQIWDTAGQERFKSLRTPFYRGADLCILTFALDDASSFRALGEWKAEFLHYADVDSKEPFPFVVLGNKCDKERREVSSEDALQWLKSQNISSSCYMETSAKEAMNVQEAFLMGVKTWAKLEQQRDKELDEDTVRIDHIRGASSGGCC